MSSALRLEVPASGLATVIFDLPGRKVNVFTREVLAELDSLLAELAERRDIRCLILLSGKPDNFIAGADIDEIAAVEDPAAAEEGVRHGQRLFSRWSALPFPTVAAVRGTCLGGGTELCLASTHTLISDRADIRIGLPEVRLGIVPAWGGCARLPRRVGIAAALDIILAGKAINSRKAFRIGLADALLPDASFLHEVRDWAASAAAAGRDARRRSDLKRLLLEKNPLGRRIVFNQARKRVLARTGGQYPAPLRAIEIVEAGVTRGLDAALDAEARAAGELAVSPLCKNLVHVFRLVEGAKRNGSTAEPLPVRAAAVLGAGVMGGAIAQLIADRANIPVRLKDIGTEPLASGLAHAASLFDQQVERRRLSRSAAKTKMGLLHPTLDYSGFEGLDLVIEAIVENLEVKRQVFAEVAGHMPEGAVLASNTSSLSIDLIAADTPRPERVVGMHFFNPVHRMPLVEVIGGDRTSEEVLTTIVQFARRLGKTPVVVGNGPGFLVNRLLGFYMTEALWLLDEGFSVADIDRAMTDWGMPMGPLTLIDEVGIDVVVKVGHILAAAFGDRLPQPSWADRLAESGRLGAKAGLGIYRYEKGRRKAPDPEIGRLFELPQPTRAGEPSRFVDRMVLPMVNEAARCLAEGVVRSPADLDLAMIMGTGFPPFRGGLCRWADQQGLGDLKSVLERLSSEVGGRFRPSDALERAVVVGGLYACYG